MKLIKEYDIPENGDCNNCPARRNYICCAFGEWIAGVFQIFQCQQCKDWLKKQYEKRNRSKV